jgi:hypothetical protein
MATTMARAQGPEDDWLVLEDDEDMAAAARRAHDFSGSRTALTQHFACNYTH